LRLTRQDLTQNHTNKNILSKNTIKAILEGKQYCWHTDDNSSIISSYSTNSIAANSPIEDSHVELVQGSQGFFGVFDGHSGDKTAELAAQNLVPLFRNTLRSERLKQLDAIKNATKGHASHPLLACTATPDKLCAAVLSESNENKKNALRQLSIAGVVQSTLHRAFVDHDLRQVQDSLNGGGLSLSGACALLAHVLGDHLFVANAGDCRAVLGHCDMDSNAVEQWSAIPLSKDHRLDNESEKVRVTSSHPGETDIIKDGRVKGSLMPTRGFGDFAFKLKCLKPVLMKCDSLWNPPYITADPEVIQHQLKKGDQFLIIASDGLWEQFSNTEVVRMVAECMNKGDSNVCTYLIEKTLLKVLGTSEQERISTMLQMDPKCKRQYHDDISIVVVFFNTSHLTSHSIDQVWKQEANFELGVSSSGANLLAPSSSKTGRLDELGTLTPTQCLANEAKATQVRVS